MESQKGINVENSDCLCPFLILLIFLCFLDFANHLNSTQEKTQGIVTRKEVECQIPIKNKEKVQKKLLAFVYI